MNIKEQITKLLELDKAIDAGKEIQSRRLFTKKWELSTGKEPKLNQFEYRVKPKPLEIFVNMYSSISDFVFHPTKEIAISKADTGVTRTAVKFIEAEDQS